jgi:hypothetical protein
MNQSVEHLDPQWFQLYDWEDKPIDGCKILLSFQLLTPAQAAQPIPNIAPPTLPMHLEVATLGCRSLTSMLGVHKTYIEFEMPNGKRFKTNMSKDPNANNPNFLQVRPEARNGEIGLAGRALTPPRRSSKSQSTCRARACTRPPWTLRCATCCLVVW